MDVFLALLGNIFPLYIIIVLGWVAGRFYDVDRGSLAGLAIFVLSPIIAFYYVSNLDFKAEYLALPLIIYCIYTMMTLTFFRVGLAFYSDKRANLLGMCCGVTNTGYMGLPIVIMLLPEQWVGVYVFALSGGLLFEATVMYYIANRGNFSPKESFNRAIRFPTIYAIVAGLIVNALGVDLPTQMESFFGYFKGAYVVIGMMIIGVSLSTLQKLKVSMRFLSLVFFAQFIVWPLVVLGVIALDKYLVQMFSPEIYLMLMVVAIVPPAANIAAFAAKLDLSPEKAATTVLFGTVFALFYIPAVLVLSGLY